MSKSSSKVKSLLGALFLTLFALPFAAFGVWMAWSLTSMLWLAWASSSWEAVPATITHVELEKSGDEGSQKVLAEYQYRYAGQAYESDRVGLSPMADNISSHHRKLYDKWRAAWKAEKTVPCYVDPRDPTQSLLDRQLRMVTVVFHLPFVLCFNAIGFGLITGAVYTVWKSTAKASGPTGEDADGSEASLSAGEDWGDGVIRSSRKAFFFAAGFAAFWNSLCWPMAVLFLSSEKAKPWWVYPIVLGFPVIGVALAVWAVRLGLAWRKYGESTLRLATVPGVVGGKLTGVLIAPAAVADAGVVRLTLTCTREEGSGEDAKTVLVWQDEREIGRLLDDAEPGRVGVPIVFTIPSHAPPTNDAKSIAWTLRAKAPLRGIDYDASFEVPVARTAASQQGVDVGLEPLSEYEVDRPLDSLLADEGIVAEPLAERGAVRYFARSARSLTLALTITFFLLLFGGVAIGLLVGGEWIGGSAFGVFSLILLYATFDTWLAESELIVTRDEWRVRSGWRGFPRKGRKFQTKHVRDVFLQTGSTTQTGGNYQRHQDAMARLLGEPKPVRLLRGLSGTAAARKLTAELRQRAGLDSTPSDALSIDAPAR
ncbi:hypothetical protein Pla108_25910 [Botrimarina colliarenosi]|uniref:DUF3592 domain-containing protein n=1 Tax=Botrimarina colliarenosi TaxID=2528001 RepID=A0A5C6ABR4_9BACT|nr:DUF3592 domain-containing protein [Botrimarina colliarenosi]TWT96817.1 hypothetical protein Pla108_25910 [Botrimarina colliarenosi]